VSTYSGILRRPAVTVVLRAPFTAAPWRATAQLASGCVLGMLSTNAMILLGGLALGFSVTGLLGLPMIAALLSCSRVFTGWQRTRFAAYTGWSPPEPAAWPAAGTRRGRLLAEARSRTARRAGLYHLLAGVVNTAGFVAAIGFWSIGIALATVAVYSWTLPAVNLFGWHMHDPLVLAGIAVGGLVVLFTAPWVALGGAALDRRAAAALFGPSRADLFDQQVRLLTASRDGLLSATDLERRRLERDLHDGIQQRLTSLAVNLGLARETFTDLPEPVRAVIVDAHEEAKQTLSDLRDIVRGLHPAVLESRGLDAALSGIVAHSRIPVRLTVAAPCRPSPTVEAVAYFVVCEALTNVTKHAGATLVDVTIRRVGDILHVRIADDGKGGASADGGTGMRGMAQRVASVDGTIDIVSPAGNGTTITVELPCET
jgi:signal transduction histidine kinase